MSLSLVPKPFIVATRIELVWSVVYAPIGEKHIRDRFLPRDDGSVEVLAMTKRYVFV